MGNRKAGQILHTGAHEDLPPQWYGWDGGFFALGRSAGVVPRHSHHAIQISIALEGRLRLWGEATDWREYAGAVVAADAPHQYDGCGRILTMIFVDPESRQGRWLSDSLREPINEIPAARLERCVPKLWAFLEDPTDAVGTARLVDDVVRDLCAGPPPPFRLDPRIARALELIREMDVAKLSLEDAASSVFLSSSRFAHLFTENVGVPFRHYVLWRRLNRALLAVGRGQSLSAAAHATGFADSAHLTRTCYQMFGVPPSLLLKFARFYEIPAPFTLEPDPV